MKRCRARTWPDRAFGEARGDIFFNFDGLSLGSHAMRGKLEKRGDYRPGSGRSWTESDGWGWKYEGKSKSDGKKYKICLLPKFTGNLDEKVGDVPRASLVC
jgi:hypothetical protein